MSTTATITDLPLSSGTWAVDHAHSTVNFSVRHLGLAKVRGQFTGFDGSVTVGDMVEATEVIAQVDLASVDTNNPDRDAHLRSPDFFDAESKPRMSFRSTAVSGSGDGYTLEGDLTIGQVTRPAAFDVEFFGLETFPMDQSTRAGFSATGSISRADFDVTFDVPLGGDKMMIGDKVNIELDVQLVAP